MLAVAHRSRMSLYRVLINVAVCLLFFPAIRAGSILRDRLFLRHLVRFQEVTDFLIANERATANADEFAVVVQLPPGYSDLRVADKVFIKSIKGDTTVEYLERETSALGHAGYMYRSDDSAAALAKRGRSARNTCCGDDHERVFRLTSPVRGALPAKPRRFGLSRRRRVKVVGLQVSIRQSADVIIVDLQGRATIGRSNDLLSSQLRKLIEDGTRKVLLNLVGLVQLDSSSLSTIARAFVSLVHEGGRLKLLRPRGSVRLVLETARLLEVIPNYEDEAQALASFS